MRTHLRALICSILVVNGQPSPTSLIKGLCLRGLRAPGKRLVSMIGRKYESLRPVRPSSLRDLSNYFAVRIDRLVSWNKLHLRGVLNKIILLRAL